MNKMFWTTLFFKHLYFLAALMLLPSCDFIKYFQETSTNTQPTTTYYIISVYLESPSIQFADLSIIKTPKDSKFQIGALISKIPGQIVLDKAGTWQFQARSDDIESEIITLRVPQERSFTIIMP
jgi:hypothetical protein